VTSSQGKIKRKIAKKTSAKTAKIICPFEPGIQFILGHFGCNLFMLPFLMSLHAMTWHQLYMTTGGYSIHTGLLSAKFIIFTD
jgi:hypothetical protein